jgi:uncharacterized protein (TIGR02217 family)
MALFDNRLPDCYSFGAKGGPKFSTEVNRTQGGQRFANRNWTYPLHVWDISHGIKTQEDFETIRAFFYNVAGQADGFRFKDHLDFEANSQPLNFVSGSTWQTYRAYVRGSRTFLRKITRPRQTIVIKRNRSGTITTITPTVDYSTGQVTAISGHAPLTDTYTWTGEFDIPVAFTTDFMEVVIENKRPDGQLLIRWPTAQVEEIRE